MTSCGRARAPPGRPLRAPHRNRNRLTRPRPRRRPQLPSLAVPGTPRTARTPAGAAARETGLGSRAEPSRAAARRQPRRGPGAPPALRLRAGRGRREGRGGAGRAPPRPASSSPPRRPRGPPVPGAAVGRGVPSSAPRSCSSRARPVPAAARSGAAPSVRGARPPPRRPPTPGAVYLQPGGGVPRYRGGEARRC